MDAIGLSTHESGKHILIEWIEIFQDEEYSSAIE